MDGSYEKVLNILQIILLVVLIIAAVMLVMYWAIYIYNQTSDSNEIVTKMWAIPVGMRAKAHYNRNHGKKHCPCGGNNPASCKCH